jgi:hypothetical protein
MEGELMKTELKITQTVRPCFARIGDTKHKAIFHMFTKDGYAIVELENGECWTLGANQIKFTDNIMREYYYADTLLEDNPAKGVCTPELKPTVGYSG